MRANLPTHPNPGDRAAARRRIRRWTIVTVSIATVVVIVVVLLLPTAGGVKITGFDISSNYSGRAFLRAEGSAVGPRPTNASGPLPTPPVTVGPRANLTWIRQHGSAWSKLVAVLGR